MKVQHYDIDGYETREKTVASAGSSGRALVPKSWIGRKVIMILTEPLDEQPEK